MPIHAHARKSSAHRVRPLTKRSQPAGHVQANPRHSTKPSVAKKLREVDEALQRGDYDALLDIADQSLERITHIVQEMAADQRRALKKMIKVEKHIDRTQAETARMLDRLVNGN
jgi:CBS-domain-containing membrane protein